MSEKPGKAVKVGKLAGIHGELSGGNAGRFIIREDEVTGFPKGSGWIALLIMCLIMAVILGGLLAIQP